MGTENDDFSTMYFMFYQNEKKKEYYLIFCNPAYKYIQITIIR